MSPSPTIDKSRGDTSLLGPPHRPRRTATPPAPKVQVSVTWARRLSTAAAIASASVLAPNFPGQAKQVYRLRAVPNESAPLHHLTQAGTLSVAAAGPAAAAPTGARAGKGGRAAGGETAHRDRRQELHRVVMALRAGTRRRRLSHRTAQLERVAAGAAPVLVTWHGGYFTHLPPRGYVARRRPRARSHRSWR
jgi:hypothetical protein